MELTLSKVLSVLLRTIFLSVMKETTFSKVMQVLTKSMVTVVQTPFLIYMLMLESKFLWLLDKVILVTLKVMNLFLSKILSVVSSMIF